MKTKPIKLSASIMCDSFRRLEESLAEMERAGVDLIHVDVMDGTFVPNFTLGTDVLKAIKGMTGIPVDVHLMCITPERHLDMFLPILTPGDYFSLHQEACLPLTRSLLKVRDSGTRAGIALNPSTPVSAVEQVLSIVDFVLLMAVEPGFAGQSIVPYAFDKIASMRRLAGSHNPDVEIEIDGNVSFEYAPLMVEKGADILVGGTSSIFRPGVTVHEACARLRGEAVDCSRV